TATIAAADAIADERRPVAAVVTTAAGAPVGVPLPIARPAWGARMIVANETTVSDSAQASNPDAAGVAPPPGDSGLKSGSAEALAVQLEGAQLLSSEGDVVGKVEKVIDEPGSGRQAVISVGGFLGIGKSRVLLPADSLVPSGKGMVRTELTEKQLKSLPSYEM